MIYLMSYHYYYLILIKCVYCDALKMFRTYSVTLLNDVYDVHLITTMNDSTRKDFSLIGLLRTSSSVSLTNVFLIYAFKNLFQRHSSQKHLSPPDYVSPLISV